MNSNTWLKIETIGLCLGLLGTSIFILIFIFGFSFLGVSQELFRGGEPLAMILATCLIIGLASCVLFIINLLFKRRARLRMRFAGIVMFLLSIALIGTSLGI